VIKKFCVSLNAVGAFYHYCQIAHLSYELADYRYVNDVSLAWYILRTLSILSADKEVWGLPLFQRTP